MTTIKEKLDELFKGKYGEPVNLRDYISMCLKEGFNFSNSILLQNLEYYLAGKSDNIPEGSPVVLNGNEIRLHYIYPYEQSEREAIIDLYENHGIMIKLACIHNMEYDPERAKRLSNKLVFTTVTELEELIKNIKEEK